MIVKGVVVPSDPAPFNMAITLGILIVLDQSENEMLGEPIKIFPRMVGKPQVSMGISSNSFFCGFMKMVTVKKEAPVGSQCLWSSKHLRVKCLQCRRP
jgi:hypothetical protein